MLVLSDPQLWTAGEVHGVRGDCVGGSRAVKGLALGRIPWGKNARPSGPLGSLIPGSASLFKDRGKSSSILDLGLLSL